MQTYHLSPRFFVQLKRRLLLVFGPLGVLIAGFAVWMASRQSGDLGLLPQILPALVIGAVLGFAGWNAARTQAAAFSTFRLTLNGDTLTRSQARLPTLTIDRPDITAIRETAGAGLWIRTADPRHGLVIPATLEGYPELRAVLASWRPIEVAPASQGRLRLLIIPFAVILPLAGFVVLTSTANPLLGLIAGGLLVIILLASIPLVRRSPQADARTKSLIWLVLLPVFSIVIRMVALATQWAASR